jgi:hypothetical protein
VQSIRSFGRHCRIAPTCASNLKTPVEILAFDKGIHRSTLADISIEGQFHARQWKEVEYLEMLTKTRPCSRLKYRSIETNLYTS